MGTDQESRSYREKCLRKFLVVTLFGQRKRRLGPGEQSRDELVGQLFEGLVVAVIDIPAGHCKLAPLLSLCPLAESAGSRLYIVITLFGSARGTLHRPTEDQDRLVTSSSP
ncbi:hypothetical protein [Halorhabdus sp. CUG00001]|uniref:hypothetical protein n=1 Tax=Halorhabdus sp. CUG00001 TaxID=2600297 RepID=UPI00131DF7C9|nr:hypothetical protein [Halorhabdus sp. CUG00001]